MNEKEFYQNMFPFLEQSFARSNWVLAEGFACTRHLDFDPEDKQITVQPIDMLHTLTAEWGMEVFLPCCGAGSNAVLFPFDFEVAFPNKNAKIYSDELAHNHFFKKNIWPAVEYITNYFIQRDFPIRIDLTPSGGHALFYALRGTSGWDAAASIGYLEDELIETYNTPDRTGRDLKRLEPIGLDAGLVFSGFGKLARMIVLQMKQDLEEIGGLPIRISDSRKNGNFNGDTTWAGDPLDRRIMRAPDTTHGKRGRLGLRPGILYDVTYYYFDTQHHVIISDNPDELQYAMWHPEHAVHLNSKCSGIVPYADKPLEKLVWEYKSTGLSDFDDDFESTPALAPGEGSWRVMEDSRLSPKTREMSGHPFGRMLNPYCLREHFADLLGVGWHPKHIACSVLDRYREDYPWKDDWFREGMRKYSAERRANYWASSLCAELLFEAGLLKL